MQFLKGLRGKTVQYFTKRQKLKTNVLIRTFVFFLSYHINHIYLQIGGDRPLGWKLLD